MAYYLAQVLQSWSTPGFTWDEPIEWPIEPIGDPIGMSLGFWMPSSIIPTKGSRTKKKRIPDVFVLGGFFAVSQRFKDLVEEFEPDIHQFFPITLSDFDGSKVEPDYYIFNCMVAIDTILVKESGLKWTFRDHWQQPHLDIPARDPFYRWKLSKPQIAGRHIWTDFYTRPPSEGFYVSDELFKKIQKNKIRFFKERYCEELDIPWAKEDNIQTRLDWEAKHGLIERSRPWLRKKMEDYRKKMSV